MLVISDGDSQPIYLNTKLNIHCNALYTYIHPFCQTFWSTTFRIKLTRRESTLLETSLLTNCELVPHAQAHGEYEK